MIYKIINYKIVTPGAITPKYQTRGSAAFDLHCLLETESIVLKPNETAILPTGLAFEIPKGYVGLMYIRSSVACKRGIVLTNQVGVIDSDYRGEVMIPIMNITNKDITINNHERLTQMIITPYVLSNLNRVNNLESTERNIGGFGSTGK